MNYRIPVRAVWVILLMGVFIAESVSAAAYGPINGGPLAAGKRAVHFAGIGSPSAHAVPVSASPAPVPLKPRCTDAAFPVILLLLLIYASGLKRK